MIRALRLAIAALSLAAGSARAGALDLSAEKLPEPAPRCLRWLASESQDPPGNARVLLVPAASPLAEVSPVGLDDARAGRIDCANTTEPGSPIGASSGASGALALDVPDELDAGCWEISLVHGCAQRRIPLHALRAETEPERWLAWLDTGPVRSKRNAEYALRETGLRVIDAVPLMGMGGTLVRVGRSDEPAAPERMQEALTRLKSSSEYRHREVLFSGAGAAQDAGWSAQASGALRLQARAQGKGARVALIGSGAPAADPARDFTGFEPAVGLGGSALSGVVAQLAPAAKLASLAACRDEPGGASARCWSSALVRALDAAVAGKVRIALLGWRGPEDAQVARALERAAKAGVLLIAPVGDSGDERAPAFPASHPDVLGVTAVDRARAVFGPAARGEGVELAAPGVDVATSVPGAQEPRSLSGSPLAAAHVAGVAALLLELAPRANTARLREAITSSAQDLGDAGRDPVFGYGLIDACAAARALLAAGSEDPCPEAQ